MDGPRLHVSDVVDLPHGVPEPESRDPRFRAIWETRLAHGSDMVYGWYRMGRDACKPCTVIVWWSRELQTVANPLDAHYAYNVQLAVKEIVPREKRILEKRNWSANYAALSIPYSLGRTFDVLGPSSPKRSLASISSAPAQ